MRKTSMVTAVVGLSLLASACSSATNSGRSGTASEQHNEADVTFAQDMISHHKQAIEMSEIASESNNPAIRELVRQIERQQEPEIEKMESFLRKWGSSMAMGEHHMASMPGMMSEGELEELRSASGVSLDRMFLTMMVEHHKGAMKNAKREIEEGDSKDAIALATSIRQAQRSEVEEMQQLLGQINS